VKFGMDISSLDTSCWYCLNLCDEQYQHTNMVVVATC